eukprot:comp18269_c0_seq1/m.19274 comp18269_c0_seq1/g.19274  ORF comp18269_c0_seq1/g.19274 comp18269_c0_seq1/m.19274 type:complete len:243 (-) comp18269_c0_seq1:247-975(-)
MSKHLVDGSTDFDGTPAPTMTSTQAPAKTDNGDAGSTVSEKRPVPLPVTPLPNPDMPVSCTTTPPETSTDVATSEHSRNSVHRCSSCLRRKQKPGTIRFTITTVTGGMYSVKCKETDTYAFLTFKLYAKTGMRPERQRLVLARREIVCSEEATMKECGVQNGSMLVLVPKMTTGFLTHVRPAEVPQQPTKQVQVEEEPEEAPVARKREPGWWKSKQSEHESMRSKMEQLKERMAAKKQKGQQ